VANDGTEGRCFAAATSIEPPPGTPVFCGGGVALAEASINNDGRWVAFAANAQNLVPGDTNNQTDVFLRDRVNRTTTRISLVGTSTQTTGGSSLEPDISADGRYVAFSSAATNLAVPSNQRQVFVRDTVANTTTQVSNATGGAPQGNGASSLPAISADGRWVTFSSLATNLVAGDTNARADIFLHDRANNVTTRISVGPGGVQANNSSLFPSISGDGRFVTYDSSADNLVPGDDNGRSDGFIYDRTTGTTSRVSLTRTLGQANGGSFFTSPSFDGRYVAFSSEASNLVPGDSNSDIDVFVHDRTGPLPFSDGYRLVASDGGIFAFGNAPFFGSTGALTLNKPIVGMASTPRNDGYWMVASDGGIFAFGKAKFFGSTGDKTLTSPIVGMAATPTGAGYWLVGANGAVYNFGDAELFGNLATKTLAKPIVTIASSATGNGYYLVASDGGVFAFGDALFKGSTGALKLNQPIVGMAGTPSGGGYHLVAADGGIFAFGDAAFKGSTGALKLNQPIVAMAANTSGGGYWLIARDGGIFAFGDALFKGSTGALKLNQPVVGGAAA
jgi:Tol biopolymer transport system component